MARYENVSKGDLTFSDGTTLSPGNQADVDPSNAVELGWVDEGKIALVQEDPPETAKKTRAKAEPSVPAVDKTNS